MKVLFPKYKIEWGKSDKIDIAKQHHRYYNIHIKYVLNMLIHSGADVELVEPEYFSIRNSLGFEIKINDNLILFDFSDFTYSNFNNFEKYKAVFKFHYSEDFKDYPNVHPFSPVNFHEWDLFYDFKNIKYKAEGKILNNQRPGGAAIERRTRVQEMLLEKYGKQLDISITNPQNYYKKVGECLVSICVPGARNDMLDRGQGQYMFLGACTISPKLVTLLSYNKELIPGVHYIECLPDYSDLIDKIEWVKDNKTAAIQIGQNAKELFFQTSTPEKQLEWIKQNIK
jgi:hypothetical protein